MCTYTVVYVHKYIYIYEYMCAYYSISSYKVNSVASLGHQAPSFGRVFFGCRLVAVRKMSESATVCWFVVSKRLRLSILFLSNSLESSQRYGGGCASSSVFFCWECLFTFSDTLCAKIRWAGVVRQGAVCWAGMIERKPHCKSLHSFPSLFVYAMTYHLALQ